MKNQFDEINNIRDAIVAVASNRTGYDFNQLPKPQDRDRGIVVGNAVRDAFIADYTANAQGSVGSALNNFEHNRSQASTWALSRALSGESVSAPVGTPTYEILRRLFIASTDGTSLQEHLPADQVQLHQEAAALALEIVKTSVATSFSDPANIEIDQIGEHLAHKLTAKYLTNYYAGLDGDVKQSSPTDLLQLVDIRVSALDHVAETRDGEFKALVNDHLMVLVARLITRHDVTDVDDVPAVYPAWQPVEKLVARAAQRLNEYTAPDGVDLAPLQPYLDKAQADLKAIKPSDLKDTPLHQFNALNAVLNARGIVASTLVHNKIEGTDVFNALKEVEVHRIAPHVRATANGLDKGELPFSKTKQSFKDDTLVAAFSAMAFADRGRKNLTQFVKLEPDEARHVAFSCWEANPCSVPTVLAPQAFLVEKEGASADLKKEAWAQAIQSIDSAENTLVLGYELECLGLNMAGHNLVSSRLSGDIAEDVLTSISGLLSACRKCESEVFDTLTDSEDAVYKRAVTNILTNLRGADTQTVGNFVENETILPSLIAIKNGLQKLNTIQEEPVERLIAMSKKLARATDLLLGGATEHLEAYLGDATIKDGIADNIASAAQTKKHFAEALLAQKIQPPTPGMSNEVAAELYNALAQQHFDSSRTTKQARFNGEYMWDAEAVDISRKHLSTNMVKSHTILVSAGFDYQKVYSEAAEKEEQSPVAQVNLNKQKSGR